MKHFFLMQIQRQEKENDKQRTSPDGTRKLQDEINMLTKRNCELESQLRSLESSDTLDGGDKRKIKPKFTQIS